MKKFDEIQLKCIERDELILCKLDYMLEALVKTELSNKIGYEHVENNIKEYNDIIKNKNNEIVKLIEGESCSQ